MQHRGHVLLLLSMGIIISLTGCNKLNTLLHQNPEPPQVMGIEQGKQYTDPITITLPDDLQREHIIVSATIDGHPYDFGSEYSTTGNHTLLVNAINLFNQSISHLTVTFNIDTARPATPNILGVLSNQLYTQAVSITIENEEVGVTYSATINNQSLVLGAPFSDNGTHSLTITSTRLANDTTLSNHFTFTIDTLRPDLSGIQASNIGGATASLDSHGNKIYPGPVRLDIPKEEKHTYVATIDDAPYTLGSLYSTPGSHTLVIFVTRDANNTTSTKNITFTIQEPTPIAESTAIDESTPIVESTPIAIPTISGIQHNGIYTPGITLAIETEQEGIIYSATMDGQPFTLGSLVHTLGSHTLTITAIRTSDGIAQTNRFSFTILSPIVSFTNPLIENLVRLEIGKPTGELTVEDCENVGRLDLSSLEISDISDLAHLTNLEQIALFSTQISDISALAKLTNLEYLNLSNTQISDISALDNLTNLEALFLNNTQISNISALDNLTNLELLFLNNTQISDISALDNLTNLELLFLHNTQISDISALANLTNLVRLTLHITQISDISALAKLTNLELLSLHNTQISDISALAKLTNLEYLSLNNTQISDISDLAKLTNLKKLDLRDTQISDITALAHLTNLEVLNISATPLNPAAIEILETLENNNVNNNLSIDQSIISLPGIQGVIDNGIYFDTVLVSVIEDQEITYSATLNGAPYALGTAISSLGAYTVEIVQTRISDGRQSASTATFEIRAGFSQFDLSVHNVGTSTRTYQKLIYDTEGLLLSTEEVTATVVFEDNIQYTYEGQQSSNGTLMVLVISQLDSFTFSSLFTTNNILTMGPDLQTELITAKGLSRFPDVLSPGGVIGAASTFLTLPLLAGSNFPAVGEETIISYAYDYERNKELIVIKENNSSIVKLTQNYILVELSMENGTNKTILRLLD